MPKNTHKCHAFECNRTVAPRYLMCGKHWYMVPKSLQTTVWQHYRPGQEIDKQPTREYLIAAYRAIHAVAKAEGKNKEHINSSFKALIEATASSLGIDPVDLVRAIRQEECLETLRAANPSDLQIYLMERSDESSNNN